MLFSSGMFMFCERLFGIVCKILKLKLNKRNTMANVLN